MRRRVVFTPGFWLMAALLWVMDPQLLLPAALAALLHELGHALVLLLSGVSIRRLRFTAWGLDLAVEGVLPHRRELPAAAAGPAVSILTAFLAARLGRFLFAGVSLALGLFNLLPIPPLDGGRAVRALCALLLSPDRSLRVSRWTAVAAAGLTLGLALALLVRFGALSFFLLALWLVRQAIFGENKA